MDELKKHLFKLDEIKFAEYNLTSLDNTNEIDGVIVVITDDYAKAFAFKPYNRVANKDQYLVIEEDTDLERIVKGILGEATFNRLPNVKQFHNDKICRYLGALEFSNYSINEFTHLKSYIKNNFEETEDEVKHYEVFNKNIVIVPAEFYNLVREKVMPAAV